MATISGQRVGTTLRRIPQFYETTIIGSGLSGSFVVVPRAFIAEDLLAGGADDIARAMGVERVAALQRPSMLPSILAATWRQVAGGSAPDATAFAERFQRYPTEHDDLNAFVEYLSFAEIVPAESSPLSPKSLAALVMTGSATGVYLGFFVVAGGTPLALLTVPLGVIICGAAFGVAKGLEGGLEARLRSILADGESTTSLSANPRIFDDGGPHQIFEEHGPQNFKGVDIMRAVRSFDPDVPAGAVSTEHLVGDGDRYLEAGSIRLAEEYYREAVDRGLAGGARRLAALLERLGDVAGAREAHAKAKELERHPGSQGPAT